jgi:hypothetical protein
MPNTEDYPNLRNGRDEEEELPSLRTVWLTCAIAGGIAVALGLLLPF